MIPRADRAWRPSGRPPPPGLHPAARLGGGALAVLSALLLPWPALPLLGVGLCWLLLRAGWRPGALGAAWRTWLPLALIVLAAHTLSAVDTAPLGVPTVTGLRRGLIALARLALMLAAVVAAGRLLPLPDLGGALAWWLQPWRRSGLQARNLDLMLTVAAGTAPRTLAEASRLRDCLRLRLRCAGRGGPGRLAGLRERLLVVPPLMEGLARRAESLPLALAGRLPTPPRPVRMPRTQLLVLVLWSAALILAAR